MSFSKNKLSFTVGYLSLLLSGTINWNPSITRLGSISVAMWSTKISANESRPSRVHSRVVFRFYNSSNSRMVSQMVTTLKSHRLQEHLDTGIVKKKSMRRKTPK